MNYIEEHEYRGYIIRIWQDDSAENPYRSWDTLGTLYTAHRRYCFHKEFDSHFNIHEVFEDKIGNFSPQFLRKYVALPVYMYEHGGCTVKTTPFNDPWDSGFLGIVAVSLNKVRDQFGVTRVSDKLRKEVEEILRNELKILDDYLRGNVFGFTICKDYECEDYDNIPTLPEEDTESWGFYGVEQIELIYQTAHCYIDEALDPKPKKIPLVQRVFEVDDDNCLCIPTTQAQPVI